MSRKTSDLVFRLCKVFNILSKLSSVNYSNTQDRAERHCFLQRLCYFIFLFFFPLFLGGKRKGEKNNQSRGQKQCLSDWLIHKHEITQSKKTEDFSLKISITTLPFSSICKNL